MKKIVYKDNYDKQLEFYYKLEEYQSGEYGIFTGHDTIFYFYEPTITKIKKYWIFGSLVDKITYKHAFTLHGFNIESSKNSKKEVRKKISDEVDLLNRAKEIKNGEII